MLKISELNLGFNDAENYKNKENKEFFNSIFLRNESLERLCENHIFFLIGEKGTGKTAYAVYLTNNNYKNNLSSLKYIRETDYQKFHTLKQEKHLALSDYTNIWKVILYLLFAKQIKEKEKTLPILGKYLKFHNLNKAIDEYYAQAFSPEIMYAINIIEESKIVAELLAKYSNLKGEENKKISFSESRFQINLMYIQKNFEDALRSIKLSNSHILFIDGIDLRPSSIPYDEYLDCVKGLANAVWSINNDFFSSIRDSPGRLRVVLLVRPDIFETLGLQNGSNKLRDNSVFLDWITTYQEYRTSALFKMVDTLLKVQQTNVLNEGEAWNYYFPYNPPNIKLKNLVTPTSFVEFLKFSMYRPRDIVTMLSILKEEFKEKGETDVNRVFSAEDFAHPNFQNKLSDYLLGLIKDQLLFYYDISEFELFLKFFEYLNGSYAFTYNEFLTSYNSFIEFLSTNKKRKPNFFETPDIFLQFLYSLNILCYIEETQKGRLFRWCFREKSLSNISPKVKTHFRYEIHYGFSKALNLGGSYC